MPSVKEKEKTIKSHCKRSRKQEKWERRRDLSKFSISKHYIDILSRHLLKYFKLLHMFSFLLFSEVSIFSISVVTCHKTTVYFGPILCRFSIYMKNVPYYNFEFIEILNLAFDAYNFLEDSYLSSKIAKIV